MKILLPVDGSENALEAVRHAMRLANEGLRVTCVLVNVQEPPSLYEVVAAHSAEVIEQVSEAAAEHALAPAGSLLREAGLAFETEVGHGDPAHQIADIAERCGCDLIILGARGMEPVEGALGSATESVLRHASMPVMVVRRNEG